MSRKSKLFIKFDNINRQNNFVGENCVKRPINFIIRIEF